MYIFSAFRALTGCFTVSFCFFLLPASIIKRDLLKTTCESKRASPTHIKMFVDAHTTAVDLMRMTEEAGSMACHLLVEKGQVSYLVSFFSVGDSIRIRYVNVKLLALEYVRYSVFEHKCAGVSACIRVCVRACLRTYV